MENYLIVLGMIHKISRTVPWKTWTKPKSSNKTLYFRMDTVHMVLKRIFFFNLKIPKWSDFYQLEIDGMVAKVSLFLKKTYMKMA